MGLHRGKPGLAPAIGALASTNLRLGADGIGSPRLLLPPMPVARNKSESVTTAGARERIARQAPQQTHRNAGQCRKTSRNATLKPARYGPSQGKRCPSLRAVEQAVIRPARRAEPSVSQILLCLTLLQWFTERPAAIPALGDRLMVGLQTLTLPV